MSPTTMSDLAHTRPSLTSPAEKRVASRAPAARKRWPLRRLLVDTALLLVATLMASLLAIGAEPGISSAPVWILPPLTLVMLGARGMYRQLIHLDTQRELLRTLTTTSLAAVCLIAVTAIVSYDNSAVAILTNAWILSTLLLCASVPIMTLAERRDRRAGVVSAPVLIVGAGQIGSQIERRLTEQPEIGFHLVGYVDADPVPSEQVPDRDAPILGGLSEFQAVLEETGVEHVILTFTSSPDSVLIPLIRYCEDRGIHVWLVPRLFESVNLRASLENIGPLPILGLSWVDPKGWQFTIKHAIDRIVSGSAILLLSPLLLAIAIMVRLSSPGPILYRQRRIGRDGQRFEMLKFRSMRVEENHDPADWVKPGIAPGGVEGSDRRTTVGRLLRLYSLDELPQLINVLRGEMSLIGPRPERPDYVEVFDERVHRYADRHRVKSGITGLAQVNGFRGQTSLPERIELDNYYINNWSMGLDLKIFLRTFGAIRTPAE